MGCRHAGPNEVASNVDAFKDVIKTGGANRRSPMGGSANGSPVSHRKRSALEDGGESNGTTHLQRTPSRRLSAL